MSFALADLPLPLGQVLHVGAGTGGDLAAYLAAGARAVTLVEPDPDALDALAPLVAALGPEPPVRLVAAALGGGAGLLHRFGFPDLSSLRPPSGLKALFPGLREQGTEPVALQDPAALVRDLDLAEGQSHVLVIEAPGEGGAIVAALAGAGLLSRFDRVVVQDGAIPLYEGQMPLDAVAEALAAQGYGGFSRDLADPDRPHLRATRDPRLAEAEAERTALVRRAIELENALAERQAALAGLETDLSLLRAALATAEAALAGERAERESLERRLAEAETALAGERGKAGMVLAEAEAALARERTERETLARRLAEAEAALAKERAERETLMRRIAEAEENLSRRRAALSGAETALAEERARTRSLRERAEQAEKQRDRQAADLQKRDFQLAASREEMLKAQGQIELIADLLLRRES